MGRSIRRPPSPAKTAGQSTSAPATKAALSAATADRSSGASRNAGITGTAGSSTIWCTIDERLEPGPSSTNTEAPAARIAATPSANRTGSRTCRTQYSGSHTSSATSAPVRFETSGTTGSANSRPATTDRNSASTGSINGEWNACDTGSRLTRFPFSRNTSAISSTTCSTPASTTEAGPFTAAIDTSSARPASNGATTSSAAPTATIAPPGGSACINRARADTNAPASASESTPATCAAAISPTE